jgi:hypothetical protein
VGKVDKPTLIGISACALPVAAFSAWSQFETARIAGVPLQLAWVFPMATDATAFVSTRIWLDERFAPDSKIAADDPTEQRKRGVRRYAAGLAMAAILLSVGGAAAHLALQGVAVPFLLQLAIGGLPSFALAGLVHLAAIIAAANIPARSKPRTPKVSAKAAGTAEPRPPTSAVPVSTSAPKPITSPEIGQGSKRARMLAYLDEHPRTSGAELDRIFGTKDYGRGVVLTWKKRHPRDKASGE